MKTRPRLWPDARGLKIAVLHAAFNEDVVGGLLQGAREALKEMGAAEKDICSVEVPGAFELPLAARALAASKRYDALIALGVVIRGGTPHFEFVCRGVTDGVQAAMRDSGVPIAFGVLTTDDLEQALARAGGEHGNKGAEAALVAIERARLLTSVGQVPEAKP
jgi:6,7-dimethyl-8-ribityllumazine synthase